MTGRPGRRPFLSVNSKRTSLFEVLYSGLISDDDRTGHDSADGACKLVMLSHRAPPVVLAERRAADSAVTCMAHWVARAPWWRAAVRQRARLRSWPLPLLAFLLISATWSAKGLVVFARAVSISSAPRVECVLVRSLGVRVLLLFRKDVEAFRIRGSSTCGLVAELSPWLRVVCGANSGRVCANPSLAFAPVLLRHADGWNLLDFALGENVAPSLLRRIRRSHSRSGPTSSSWRSVVAKAHAGMMLRCACVDQLLVRHRAPRAWPPHRAGAATSAASQESECALLRRSASGTPHDRKLSASHRGLVATACPSAVVHSLHAACSQTHRSTPRACVAQKKHSVFLASPHLCLDSSKLALNTHDGKQ